MKYSDHLKTRLKERLFPTIYPYLIYQYPEEKYYDTATGSQIAIKSLPYAGKVKKIMIAYTENSRDVTIKTIHPQKEQQTYNRLKRGRWIKQ